MRTEPEILYRASNDYVIYYATKLSGSFPPVLCFPTFRRSEVRAETVVHSLISCIHRQHSTHQSIPSVILQAS